MTQRYIGGLIYNPPGGYSGYFNGSSSLSISSSNTVLPTGTQDFCVEMWFSWQTQSGSYPQLISNPTTNGFQIYYDVASGLFAVGIFNVSNVITYTISQTALSGGWNHLAVTRSGNTFRLFLNGILQANGTNTISFASVTTQYIGSDGSRPYTGYLSNVRTVLGAIPTPYQTSSTTNGTAVFTPPNGALQAITSTALLTCAFATFRDGSTNNYTITVNSATVSTQNPFPLTTLPNPAQGGAGNGIFSMSQYQSLKQQNLWPAIDPYFDYTTLLLHGNGTNGAQNNTFLDSSTNNFTITRNGNTTQGTFTPYGSNWSNFFNGSNQYLSIANNANLTVGASFTFECWFFATAASDGWLFGKWVAGGQEYALAVTSSNGFNFYFAPVSVGGTAISTANNVFALNTWNHVAVARTGGVITLYVNGVSAGTVSNSTAGTNGNTPLFVGVYGTGGPSNYFPGYISNLRINTTTAVYTAAFTPPTSPLTAVSGTQFLTCQSNRFIDNSSNAFAITVTGSPSVQAFSPFAPTAAYSASTVGGSGYFDGTGDYLALPDNAAFDLGLSSQAFTIETFFYPTTTTTGYQMLFARGGGAAGWNGTDGWQYAFFLYNNSLYFQFWSGSGLVSMSGSLSAAQIANQFNHLVVSYDGSNVSIFANGARLSTTTSAFGKPTTSNITQVGKSVVSAETYYPTGYIASLRVVKGTAVYSPTQTTYTVPTAPLTNITNTSLLLNFTNAAIIDNTAKNVLETVADAQISTTQSKFGGASLYFDGTGDYLSVPYSPNLNMGTGDFTCEFWVYVPSNPSVSYPSIVGPQDQIPYGIGIRYGNTGYANKFTVHLYGVAGWVGDPILASSSTYSLSQWHHVALTRSGTTLTLWVNGVSAASTTSSNQIDFASDNKAMWIGASFDGANSYFNGYIDDFRITKGIARYTSNFTPQTSQWQDQ